VIAGNNRFVSDTQAPVDRLEPAIRIESAPAWQLNQANGRPVLALSGDWMAQSGRVPAFPPDALRGLAKGEVLAFDTAGVGRWDSGLVAFLWDAKRTATAAGIGIAGDTLPPSARTLLGLLPGRLAPPAPPPRRRFDPLGWLGGATIGLLAETGILSTLLAGTAKGGFLALIGRARMRPVDLLDNIRAAGPAALTIIGVVNFLLGSIFAFVGAVQLQRFAADIYVANLVGLALVREMSAVITAIVMAGRTGGAYAARIATMQGNEEIDALQVIGIPTEDYILLPAILALILTMPLLYLYGCLIGIIGGGVVAVSMLNVTIPGYVQQILGAVPFSQFLFGFGKSIAFAILIGVTSCRIGLKAGRSAADVGIAATRAVVTGIVGIIALDSLFAVIATIFDF
jgi:phospholipid/cholesterol/gamma-HCH transport system permease protein